MSTILITDHDPDSLNRLEETLSQEGHAVIGVREAYHVLSAARQYLPDLVVLDLEMPNSNGLILCNELRSLPHMTHVPVLFTGTQHQEVVRALDAGGDDFVSKPFASRELQARVRALLRRSQRSRHPHELKLDLLHRQAWIDNAIADLTPTEFDLLEYLCQTPEKYHPAGELLEAVWNYPAGVGDTALVRNHIHNLRCKLEVNPNRPQIVVSLHGRGYRIYANIQHMGERAPVL